jgi:23S rRNA (guanine745-N1)-methyltransferase
MACVNGHSFDIAREGYVNLLIAGQRRSRQPGDSAEMVAARRRFLATGSYDRVTNAITLVAARAMAGAASRLGSTPTLLDVGCGDGHHTRRVAENVTAGAPGLDAVDAVVCGIDVAKAAVAPAAREHPLGWYAVASAADMPLPNASVDVALNVFGPAMPAELARVLHGGGTVVTAHPGRNHLAGLRRIVYPEARSHQVKGPLRQAGEWFAQAGSVTVTFPLVIDDSRVLRDLFTMTPYRWHAPPDIGERLDAEAGRPGGFVTDVDVVITSYARRPSP